MTSMREIAVRALTLFFLALIVLFKLVEHSTICIKLWVALITIKQTNQPTFKQWNSFNSSQCLPPASTQALINYSVKRAPHFDIQRLHVRQDGNKWQAEAPLPTRPNAANDSRQWATQCQINSALLSAIKPSQSVPLHFDTQFSTPPKSLQNQLKTTADLIRCCCLHRNYFRQ